MIENSLFMQPKKHPSKSTVCYALWPNYSILFKSMCQFPLDLLHCGPVTSLLRQVSADAQAAQICWMLELWRVNLTKSRLSGAGSFAQKLINGVGSAGTSLSLDSCLVSCKVPDWIRSRCELTYVVNTQRSGARPETHMVYSRHNK